MQPCGWRTVHGVVLGVCWGLWPTRPDGPSEKTQWPEELQRREEWIHMETEVVAEKLPEMTHRALAGKELGNISTSVFLFMCASTSAYKNPTLQNREHFQLLKMTLWLIKTTFPTDKLDWCPGCAGLRCASVTVIQLSVNRNLHLNNQTVNVLTDNRWMKSG